MEPGDSSAIGERSSGPDNTDIMSARSFTLRAMGPATLMVYQPNCSGHVGTRPTDGRMPTKLQKLAGLRSDPPKSVPSARATIPVAKATAPPPDDPPQVLLRS